MTAEVGICLGPTDVYEAPVYMGKPFDRDVEVDSINNSPLYAP